MMLFGDFMMLFGLYGQPNPLERLKLPDILKVRGLEQRLLFVSFIQHLEQQISKSKH